jgi:protein SEY1
MQSIKERFGREADGMFVEAKRATVASQPIIPPWFIVLTVALGWNEFMTILRNPLLTFFFLISMAVSYFVWKTNMGGPAFQIVKATTFELGNQARVVLKDRGVDVDQFLDFEKVKDNITSALNKVHIPEPVDQIEMENFKETDKNK